MLCALPLLLQRNVLNPHSPLLDETFAHLGNVDASSHCEEVNLGVDAQVLLSQGADLLTIAEAVTMVPKEEQ